MLQNKVEKKKPQNSMEGLFTKKIWLNWFTRRKFTSQHYERTILDEPIYKNEHLIEMIL